MISSKEGGKEYVEEQAHRSPEEKSHVHWTNFGGQVKFNRAYGIENNTLLTVNT